MRAILSGGIGLVLVFAVALCVGAASAPEPIGMKAKMPYPVYWQATAVYEGKLYCFGGIAQEKLTSANGDCNYTQIYDPSTDKWTVGAPMTVPRRLCSAAVVSGKIHVTGGRDDIDALDAHEVYDPATNTWTTAKRTPSIIRGHSTVGHGGKLYLMAGNTNAYQKWVKIYDPTTDAWTSGKDMPIDRGGVAYGNAVLVPGVNRIVYIAGDKGATGAANYIGKSYAYDYEANVWDADKTLNTAIKINQFSIACDTSTNKVYTFGGQYWSTDTNSDDGNPTPQVLDCSTWTWNDPNYPPSSPPSPADRRGAGAGYINGKIYLAGGLSEGDILSLTSEYNPAADKWYQPNAPSLELRQGTHSNAVGTKIYSIGGLYNGGANGQVIVYNTSANAWSTTNAVDPHPRMSAVSGVWNGKIVLSGGDDGAASVGGDTQLYDPATDTFTALPADPVARSYAAGCVLGNTLYVFGGNDLVGDPGTLATVSALDLNAKSWSAKANLPIALEGATAQPFNGKIYIIGGLDNAAIPDNGLHDKVFIYDPAANTYTEGAEMPYATYLGASAVWGNYIIQDSGYHLYIDVDTGNRYAEMSQFYQFYEPATDTWYHYPIRGWGRAYHGSAVVGSKLYSMLGASWNYLVNRLDIARLGDSPGCSISACSAVSNPSSGPAPLTASFVAAVSTQNCTSQPVFTWSFGDGQSSTGPNPSHTFVSPGTYDWSMTVFVQGLSCTKQGTVTVTSGCYLSCAATSPPSGTVNSPISFEATATPSNCTGSPAYSWDFGDGGTSTQQNPNHTYTTVGTKNWRLTVTVSGTTCTKSGSITIAEGCSLDCTADVPASGTVGSQISFQAASTASNCTGVTEYLWIFGDGQSSTQKNPSHIYSTAGTKNWSLTVTMSGEICTRSGSINIADDCSLDCSAIVPTTGTEGTPVAFASSATPSNCTGSLTYAWAFGDGQTSTQQNPSHTYSSAGTYGWTLTATVQGVTCIKNGNIAILQGCSLVCTASATPSLGPVPLTISFIATSTAQNCAGSPSYSWDFGDGNSSTLQNPSHIYQSAGIYNWMLTVAQGGQSCTKSGSVTASLPCAITCGGFALPQSGQVPLTVGFTASSSSQNCAGSPSYSWDFGDGGHSTLQNPSHTYDSAGTYAWILTVTHGEGNCSGTGTVTVTPPPCALECSATANPSSGDVPLSVSFAATATAMNCPGQPSYSWSFGDGGGSTEQNPSHTYLAAGTYIWSMAVTAGDKSCARTGSVTVSEASCSLSCTASASPISGQSPLEVTFGATATPSNCGGSPSYSWVFGDGGSSNQQNPAHAYLSAGVFAWSVTVSIEGETCTKAGSITVSGTKPELALGEVSGSPGGAVKVPLRLVGNGNSICGVTDAVTFSSVLLKFVGAVAGPAAIAAGKGVSHTLDGNRVNLMVVGFNAEPIGDGVVAELEFAVYPGASGASELSGECLGASCQGDDIASTCVEGRVSIVSKPGDCDGSGTITIGEVQRAINMFLGAAQPGCGVDGDGNGDISIGEVQKVINGFLGMQATS